MKSYRISSYFGMEGVQNEYLKQIRNAKNTIDVLCGELDPLFFDSNEIIESSFKYITSYSSKRLDIIFNGNAKKKSEAIEKLQTENIGLLHMIKKLNQKQQDKINFNWCQIRLEKHYAIIDLRNLIIEENHEMGKPRDLYCFLEDTEAAEEWYDAFKKTKQCCEPIKIQEIIRDIKEEPSDIIFKNIYKDLENLRSRDI